MKKAKKVAHVLLAIPNDVRKILYEAHALAENDASARKRLRRWMSGANGPVLAAGRMKRDAATGAFVAMLELAGPFLAFLAHELHTPSAKRLSYRAYVHKWKSCRYCKRRFRDPNQHYCE
jgi:hypothetical protein